jgi:hypothetical protein
VAAELRRRRRRRWWIYGDLEMEMRGTTVKHQQQ